MAFSVARFAAGGAALIRDRPLARNVPKLRPVFAGKDDYPREILLEAIVRSVEGRSVPALKHWLNAAVSATSGFWRVARRGCHSVIEAARQNST